MLTSKLTLLCFLALGFLGNIDAGYMPSHSSPEEVATNAYDNLDNYNENKHSSTKDTNGLLERFIQISHQTASSFLKSNQKHSKGVKEEVSIPLITQEGIEKTIQKKLEGILKTEIHHLAESNAHRKNVHDKIHNGKEKKLSKTIGLRHRIVEISPEAASSFLKSNKKRPTDVKEEATTSYRNRLSTPEEIVETFQQERTANSISPHIMKATPYNWLRVAPEEVPHYVRNDVAKERLEGVVQISPEAAYSFLKSNQKHLTSVKEEAKISQNTPEEISKTTQDKHKRIVRSVNHRNKESKAAENLDIASAEYSKQARRNFKNILDDNGNKPPNEKGLLERIVRIPPETAHSFLKSNQKHAANSKEEISTITLNGRVSTPVEVVKTFRQKHESTTLSVHSHTVKSRMPRKYLEFEKESAVERGKLQEIVKINKEHTGKCKIETATNSKIANCSNLKLTSVPQHLPADITKLILSNNYINSHSLKAGPFRRYGQLTDLCLDNNNISSLPDKSFIGLSNLYRLKLHNNSITMESALNQSNAFVPLNKSLYALYLNNNTKNVNAPGLVYPDKALSYLTNLHSLRIDGLPNKTFGFHFKNIKNLAYLSLEGYHYGQCNLSYFRNDTFIYLPDIRYLSLSDCKIDRTVMENGALEPLVNLESLDISYNFQLGLDGFGELMYGQRNNQNLKKISMKYIIERYEPCVVLYKETLKYMRNLSLETVDATHNNIELIEYDAVEYFPKTLKLVNLTRNNIVFGAYWRHLKDMTNLQYLYLDGYDVAYRLPKYIPSKDVRCSLHREGGRSHYSELSSLVGKINVYNDNPLTIELPPKLETLTMKSYSMSYKIDTLVFNSMNKLSTVNLHGNNFPILNGPVQGLNELKHLDFSSCSVGKISNTFLSSFKSLKTFNLYDNELGEEISKGPVIFASKSLELLNLGENNIYSMNDNLLTHCPNLTTLIISNNRLAGVGSALDKLPRIKELFLTRNSIHTLPKTLRDHFENMKEQAFIDMSNNPIDCDCDNIDFLEWVTRTKIFGNNYTNYYCNYPGNHYLSEKQMFHGYDEELKLLINECADNTKLLICVVCATAAFFFILIGVIIYRFRWSMRYWYYTAKVMMTNKPNNASIEEFEYDLFVCYCHQDNDFITEELKIKLSQERNLKLLLHDKCFQAGQEIAESILKAVQHSRKTLVVMSKAMLESSWCNYEMEMARQESISTGRNVLVILFRETIPRASMSVDVLSYIRSNVVVTYPSGSQEMQEEFWDRLANDLQCS